MTKAGMSRIEAQPRRYTAGGPSGRAQWGSGRRSATVPTNQNQSKSDQIRPLKFGLRVNRGTASTLHRWRGGKMGLMVVGTAAGALPVLNQSDQIEPCELKRMKRNRKEQEVTTNNGIFLAPARPVLEG
jgi:hypothetical protein